MSVSEQVWYKIHSSIHQETKRTKSNLNLTINEAQIREFEYQNPWILWDFSLTRSMCPQIIYFIKFTSWCSSLFSPIDKLIMYFDNLRVLYQIEGQRIMTMMCLTMENGIQLVEERIMDLLYEHIIHNSNKTMVLT